MSWQHDEFHGLPYRALLPLNYAPHERRYPLVVFLHGSAERGHDNQAQLKNGVGAFASPGARGRFQAIVVAPQAPTGGSFGGQWYPGQRATQDLVLALVDELAGRRSVDPTRLYLTGLSMGAIGGWELLARAPARFAAAALVCGEPNPAQVDAITAPLWAFHGLRDDVVPPGPAIAACERLRARGQEALFTGYPDLAHESWERAFHEPSLTDWLLAHHR
jgi:predicted peptidase